MADAEFRAAAGGLSGRMADVAVRLLSLLLLLAIAFASVNGQIRGVKKSGHLFAFHHAFLTSRVCLLFFDLFHRLRVQQLVLQLLLSLFYLIIAFHVFSCFRTSVVLWVRIRLQRWIKNCAFQHDQ